MRSDLGYEIRAISPRKALMYRGGNGHGSWAGRKLAKQKLLDPIFCVKKHQNEV
jgi:hypothetical protein